MIKHFLAGNPDRVVLKLIRDPHLQAVDAGCCGLREIEIHVHVIVVDGSYCRHTVRPQNIRLVQARPI